MLRERAERALKAAAARGIAVVVAGMAAGAALAGCIAFLLVGIYARLLRETSPPDAAFLTAAAGVLLALLIVGLLLLGLRFARRAPRPSSHAPASLSAASTSAVQRERPPAALGEAGDWIAANPLAAGVGALVAGIVFGLSPELRKAVADGVRSAIRARRRD